MTALSLDYERMRTDARGDRGASAQFSLSYARSVTQNRVPVGEP